MNIIIQRVSCIRYYRFTDKATIEKKVTACSTCKILFIIEFLWEN